VPHSGWLGRYSDTLGVGNPFSAATMGTQVPLSMRGLSSSALLIPLLEETLLGSRPTDLNDVWLVQALRQIETGGTGAGPLANMLASSGVRAAQAAPGVTNTWSNALGTPIQRQLLMAANLINADLGTRVITVGFDGFDTHAGQKPIQQKLLADLDAGLQGFFGRLSPDRSRNVTVVTYSEFGRRARANDSSGTDHGTSSIAMVMGANVLGGLYGEDPGLANLDENGNPGVTADFRRLYSTVLQGWLATDSASILGASHEPFPLFAAPPGLTPTSTTSSTSTTSTSSTTSTTTAVTTAVTSTRVTPTAVTTGVTTTAPGTTNTTIAGPTTTGIPTTTNPTTTGPTTTGPTTTGPTTTTTTGPTTTAPSTTVAKSATATLIGQPRVRRTSRVVVDRAADIDGDWVGVCLGGSAPSEYVTRQILPGLSGSTGSSAVVALVMPAVAGNYELRYCAATNAQLALSYITVTD
jgi:Protein of unknown function (DUF1501)